MNPKQKFIEIVFDPIIVFFNTKLKLSGFFVGFLFIALIAIPIFKTKSRNDMDVLRKILIILALLLGFIFGIIDTLKIRGIIQWIVFFDFLSFRGK